MKLLKVVLIFGSFTLIKSHSKITFPEVERQTVIKTDPDCRESSNPWCYPSNYPDSKVIQILSKNESINQFLDKDSFSFLNVKLGSSYENICNEQTQYIYPKAAKNKDDEFMFIVNNPGGSYKHRQLVKVTKCSRPDEACGQGDVFSSFSTSCVQEYSDHKLVALSKTGEELVVDTFSFPSCCICKVDRNLEL